VSRPRGCRQQLISPEPPPLDASRALILAAFLLLLPPGPRTVAMDLQDLVAGSDRSLDAAIVSAFETADFDTRLSICAAMGRRTDPDATGLLGWLLAYSTRGDAPRREHLLRVLLESLFDPGRGLPALQQRLDANREELAVLHARWDTLGDSQLKAVLLRILPLFDPAEARPILAGAGAALVERLRLQGGRLPPAETALLLDFLRAVTVIRGADFLEPCLMVSSLSRERPVVDAARRAARAVRQEMPDPRTGQ
jgi:hypothetical protein